MKSGAEADVGVVDSKGRFNLHVPPGDYALALTSESQFGYIEHVTSPNPDVIVTLSRDCTLVQGRINGTVEPNAIIMASRASRFLGDRFLIPVTSNGDFRACLPEGSYRASVDGTMVSFQVSFRAPTNQTIEFVAYARAAVEDVPKSISLGAATFHSLVAALKRGPRVLGMGEANHGTGDFYKLRGALSLALAQTGDLRLILIEADAIGMMSLDDYVQGMDVDVEKATIALEFWITDTHEFLDFLREIRAYNQSLPDARRIHVLGFDAQDIAPPALFLIGLQADLKLENATIDLLTRVASKHGAALAEFSPEEVAMLTSELDNIESDRSTRDLRAMRTRAIVAARSLRLQLASIGKPSLAGTRDATMAELVELIIKLSGGGRVSLWAHNGHLGREPDGTTTSLGQHLAGLLGADYYPVAFLSYEGTARAWDAAGKIGVISHELGPTPAYNLESVLMNALHFPEVAWVRLDSTSSSLRQWLSLPRYTREFGSTYAQDGTQTLRQFPKAFAAVVVVKHALASTPTPTGERRVTP